MNRKVFNSDVLTLFGFIDDVEKDGEVLNYLIEHDYSHNGIEENDDVDRIVLNVLRANEKYLQAVYDSVMAQFDPFIVSKVKEHIQRAGNGTDDTTITMNGSSHQMNYGTNSGTSTNQSNTFDNATLRDTDRNTTTENVNNTIDSTNTQNGTTTKNTTNNDTETRTREGADNLDYLKAVESIYKAKTINLYTEIVKRVVADLLDPVFYFDED